MYSLGIVAALPQFTIMKTRSGNDAPDIRVTFEDGQSDILVLDNYLVNGAYSFKAVGESCSYIGHLAEDSEACVAMTGCLGMEDVELTILSFKDNRNGLFKWNRNGSVEQIADPFEVKLLVDHILYLLD